MKIANIIYEKNIVNHTQLEYINYYNESMQYENIDQSLPTLYIGWSFMKKCNPENNIIDKCDILKREIIKNKLYWECSFDEGKSAHINGVENFINKIPHIYYESNYEYVILDPIFFQLKTIDDFIEVLPENIDVLCAHKNNMVYVLNKNIIYGIDLNMYRFFKFDVEAVMKILMDRSKISHIDLDGEIYQTNYKIFPNFQYLKRFLVVMLTK